MHEFIKLVKTMRAAQKVYFRTRDRADLIDSRRLEAEVDRAIKTLQASEKSQPPWDPEEKQPSLFGGERP